MFVLGFCALMDLPKEMRPQALLQCSAQILPALLVLFAGLKRAYEGKWTFSFNNNKYLLSKWEGQMGKYLAWGNGVRTERSQIFSHPAQPNLVS